MVGQAAEQIIAGVVLSERLAVTMYGAIHRAQFGGQRNLRGLVVDPKLLAVDTFRRALTDAGEIATAVALDHPNIVPTVAVEAGGPDVVIVTRGGGRYVTVQDLITAARATRSQGGKLPIPVAAAIGRSAIDALAAAHRTKVVHGAVHPRSVLIDEDGGVRLGDFVVGRALTTAVAQGADSTMWRGLAGYLAPELVVGEDPSPGADVFAVGAMLFTMLTGDVPPGNLRVTPAVERLVQRALDSDLARRYRSAGDLLENLLEAFEDDHWELADRGEVIQAAGLSHTDSAIDEATEDLLASLAGPGAVQITVSPIRPSQIRPATPLPPPPSPPSPQAQPAPAAVDEPPPAISTSMAIGLDALLADLDDAPEHTAVDERPFDRDPISEVIAADPRRAEAIVQAHPRAPSLDDPDEDTPLPLPVRDSDPELSRRHVASIPAASAEAAAMSALAGLDDSEVRIATDDEPPPAPPPPPEERAAERRARSGPPAPEPAHSGPPAAAIARPPLGDLPRIEELPPVRLRSRAVGVVSLLVVIAGAIAFYLTYRSQQEAIAAQRARDEQARQDAEQRTRALIAAQADRGAIRVTTAPRDASVWLKLGRTNLDTVPLTSSQLHRLRIELPGYQPVDTEVVAASWQGAGAARKARVAVTLKAAPLDRKTHQPVIEPLPALPPNLAPQAGFVAGEGPLHVETSPPGAEVWLLIGYGNTGVAFPTVAGRDYELRALADGYRPGYASITADEWRDPKEDPRAPIDVARKRDAIDKHIALELDPEARPMAPKPRK